MADGLNMPEQSKADTTSPFKMLHQIDIKNTFINTKALDFDSLSRCFIKSISRTPLSTLRR